MTVPSDRNIALKEIEKKGKYKDLELEIQTIWHMKTEEGAECMMMHKKKTSKDCDRRDNNNNNNNSHLTPKSK